MTTQSPTATSESYQVRVLRTLDELESMRGAWTRLGGENITTDLDFLALLASRPEVERPHVILLEREGVLEAGIAARLERMRVRCRVCYWTIFKPTVKAIAVVHDGFVGATSGPALESARASLRESLESREAEVVYMPSVRVDSDLYRLAASKDSVGRPQIGLEQAIHWRLNLPPTMDEFMQSLSHGARSPLRRLARRLERRFPDAIRLRVFRDPVEIETLFREVAELAAKTYQHGLGVAFEDTPYSRAVTQLQMERGQFRSYVLYLQDDAVAYWQGHVWGGVFRSTFTGFDPAYAEHRVGTYVLMRMIADLCEDPDVSAIDFGIGEAEYKERYGNESWYDVDLMIYGPGLRMLAINAARSLTLAANRGGNYLVRRNILAGKLKRSWRRRLPVS